MTILIDIIISIDTTGGSDMKRRLSAVEARKRLGEVLDGVYYRGDEVVIERAGKPLAVVVPVKLYEQQQKRRQEAWDRLLEITDRVAERNKDVPIEVIEAEVDEAVQWARAQMRAEDEARRPEKSA
jgi:prevent-host-death family protein